MMTKAEFMKQEKVKHKNREVVKHQLINELDEFEKQNRIAMQETQSLSLSRRGQSLNSTVSSHVQKHGKVLKMMGWMGTYFTDMKKDQGIDSNNYMRI